MYVKPEVNPGLAGGGEVWATLYEFREGEQGYQSLRISRRIVSFYSFHSFEFGVDRTLH